MFDMANDYRITQPGQTSRFLEISFPEKQRSAHPRSFVLRLEVRSGLHRGARIKLSNRSYSIGSAIEADIVLCDSDIGARHALLHLEGRRVKIEACDGNVGVGSRVLAEGYACYLRLPAELALGNVNLRVVAAPRPPAVGIARGGTSMMKSTTGAGGPLYWLSSRYRCCCSRWWPVRFRP